VEQSRTWQFNSCWAGQHFLRVFRTWRFVTVFTKPGTRLYSEPVVSSSYPNALFAEDLFCGLFLWRPITVAARSKAWTVFARSNAGIMGSNLTQSMDVCIRLFSLCVVLCVGSGLTAGWSPVQGVLPTVYRIKKLEKRPRSNKELQSNREIILWRCQYGDCVASNDRKNWKGSVRKRSCG
jgi:hypothetical protein